MDLLAFSISLGNDVFGGGKVAEAISWSLLAEKALNKATTVGGVGGMVMLLASGFLTWKITQMQVDSDSKFDLKDIRYLPVAVVPIALLGVGLKLLFF